jgi:hypothetical protein
MTDQSSLPQVTLALALAPSLSSLVEQKTLQDNLAKSLRETLQNLSIPGEPVVRITAIENAEVAVYPFLTVTINGKFRPYATDLLRRAYCYAAGQHLEGMLTPAKIIEHLRQLPSEKVEFFVCLSCNEIVKSAPAALLTKGGVTVYHCALANKALIKAGKLQACLAAVLDLRISIADQARVAQTVKETLGKPRFILTEALIAALRPNQLEIQLPSEYLKSITLNSSEDDRNLFALLRDGLFYELGLRLPEMRLVVNNTLEAKSRHSAYPIPLSGIKGFIGITEQLQ